MPPGYAQELGDGQERLVAASLQPGHSKLAFQGTGAGRPPRRALAGRRDYWAAGSGGLASCEGIQGTPRAGAPHARVPA
jgi:hypothetical protein